MRLSHALWAAACVCAVSAVSANAQTTSQPTARWLRGDNQLLDLATASAPVSGRVTNDDSLTHDAAFDQTSDVDDLRAEFVGIPRSVVVDAIVFESVDTAGIRRDLQTVPWTRGGDDVVRTAFIRLTGDAIDRAAAGTVDRTLRVALGDRVRVTATTAASAISGEITVGRPGTDVGPSAARTGKIRAVILRAARGATTVIGSSEDAAIAIVRNQIQDASDIWLQCYVSFGDPSRADVVVADPPVGTLLAISDEDGFAAYGGGAIRFRVNDTPFNVGPTRAGATPAETALLVAEALRGAGYQPRVTENPATELGAGRSADVLARDSVGALVTFSRDGAHPLSSDARQSALVGAVDLGDGLAEFNNMTASAGSLEERTLIKSLADDDPTTIDVFVVNRFTFGTRQGEAFIENGGGPIHNAIVLDRIGLRQVHTAFTLPHEIGHILMNQPYHPDNVGPDAPWMLMDSDSNLGSVAGPKRLTWDECLRARAQSENTLPTLLTATPTTTSPAVTTATPKTQRRPRAQ